MEHSEGSGCYCELLSRLDPKGTGSIGAPLGTPQAPQQTRCLCWSVCCSDTGGTCFVSLFLSLRTFNPHTQRVHSSKGKRRALGLAFMLSPRVRLGCGGRGTLLFGCQAEE